MNDLIFKRSPWSIEGQRYKCITSKFLIRNTLEFIKKKHQLLSVCGNNPDLPQKSVLLKISSNTFQIDKPVDWSDDLKKFKLFFRDQNNTWNFITTELRDEGLYHLSLAIPEKMYKLVSRWHKRIETPFEARARFHYDSKSSADLQIINLSASGMLVCSGSEEKQAKTNSTVKAITIDIRDNPERSTTTTIDQGIIVRSFQDDNSGRVCHGITFIHKDKDSLENLHLLLS